MYFFFKHEFLICFFLVAGIIWMAIDIVDTFKWWARAEEIRNAK
jgi:hypothetical protein